MAGYLTSIHELINKTYNSSNPLSVNKADAPVTSGTTGVFNPVYGAAAFSQLNMEGNAFAILPKLPWRKSGWRVITALGGSSGDGGIAETAAIPDSTKPTFAEIKATVKQVAHVFEATAIQDGLYATDDDVTGDLEFLRGHYASLHARRLNEQLLATAETPASNNFESIDRVTASDAYATAALSAATDADIYDIDRSASSWSDAVVDHNSGTDRVLTDSIIRDTLATLEAAGARTNVILTGSDTKYRIAGLYENRVRYAGVYQEGQTFSVGLNGVSTDEGGQFGIRVATVYGIPIFVSQSVVKDTISRIYLLDTTENEDGTPRLFVALLYPTLYFESGFNGSNPDPFAIGKFTTKGVYYTAGELICTRFNVQGSIRDLK